MRYWGYFVAKLLVVAALLAFGWIGLDSVLMRSEGLKRLELAPFGRDLGYTAAVIAFGLVGVGLLQLVILDQRYRCRTCLRRLHMPVTRGKWDHFLFGAPHTEYICRFGHGTLSVAEAHFAGEADIYWHPVDDMWKELEELDKAHK